MKSITWTIIFSALQLGAASQVSLHDSIFSGQALEHASVAICITDARSGVPLLEHNSAMSLKPASILKLVTTVAALEMLGQDHTFKTILGYTGKLGRSGKLSGNIIIKGGGDPALGSPRFAEYYGDLRGRWTSATGSAGIKKIKGRVITDDTYFDYQPVPARWLWEDLGNYYGAGAFGVALYDNTYEIHLNTVSEGNPPVIVRIVPEECRVELDNRLVAAGTTDQGYVFAAPYSRSGWIEGSVPEGKDNFILKASITDPPKLISDLTDRWLQDEGIRIKGSPSTSRTFPGIGGNVLVPLDTIISPPLVDIVELLNKESINLYAEHLIKELGKVFHNEGSTESGIRVVMRFLSESGIDTAGLYMEDGSGLSPVNAVTAEGMVRLLLFMKDKGKEFEGFYASLPEAGKEGTLKNYFKDPLFDSRLRAKSGSMARVRSYAGYLTTLAGREMAFCIIINNFAGASKDITGSIEELFRRIILDYY